jgi:hypothetical protein
MYYCVKWFFSIYLFCLCLGCNKVSFSCYTWKSSKLKEKRVGVYACVCMFMCMSICVYMCMCVCICTCACICHVHVYAAMCVYMLPCVYMPCVYMACACICHVCICHVCICACVCVCECTCIPASLEATMPMQLSLMSQPHFHQHFSPHPIINSDGSSQMRQVWVMVTQHWLQKQCIPWPDPYPTRLRKTITFWCHLWRHSKQM